MLSPRFNVCSSVSFWMLLLFLTGCQGALEESDLSSSTPSAPISQGPNPAVTKLTNRLSGDIRSLGKNLLALRRGLTNQESRIESLKNELQILTSFLEKYRGTSEANSKKFKMQLKNFQERLKDMDRKFSYIRAFYSRGVSSLKKDKYFQTIRSAGVPPKKNVQAAGVGNSSGSSQGFLAAGVPSSVSADAGLLVGAPAKLNQPKTPALPASEVEFNEAFRVFKKERNFPRARVLFDRFILKYPTHELADDAQFWIGESYYQEKNFERAILSFNKVQVDYANGDKAPDALLKEALAFLNLGDKASAHELLGRVVKKYPSSGAATDAVKYLKSL